MKKFILVLIVMLFACNVTAQWWEQRDNEILGRSGDCNWVFLPSGQTSDVDSLYFFDTTYGADGDTLYSDIYFNLNKMALDLAVAAPASVLDSIQFKINYYTGETGTSAGMIFNRTLDFNWGPPGNDATTRRFTTTLDTSGYWHTDVGRISYRADLYCMLELITLSGHSVVSDSVNVQVKARAKLGRGE